MPTITFKIFNSRTGVEHDDTGSLNELDPGHFFNWLNDNNTCYEEGDANRPENDPCDYELRVYSDGERRYFNPETQIFDLTSEPSAE